METYHERLRVLEKKLAYLESKAGLEETEAEYQERDERLDELSHSFEFEHPPPNSARRAPTKKNQEEKEERRKRLLRLRDKQKERQEARDFANAYTFLLRGPSTTQSRRGGRNTHQQTS
jgi:hypothetical protein